MSGLQRGFTLLEVLVAMTITAVLGAGAFLVLTQGLLNQERLEERMAVLRQAQRIDRLLADDLMQVVARPVRDEYGDLQAALRADPPLSYTLTRTGWRDAATLLQQLEQFDDLVVRRSQLQRVVWRLEDQTLLRDYWMVLDRDVVSEPRSQRLLENVEQFELRFLKEGEWREQWPPDQPDAKRAAADLLPEGIEVTYQHPQLGLIRRVFPVAFHRPDSGASP